MRPEGLSAYLRSHLARTASVFLGLFSSPPAPRMDEGGVLTLGL